MLQSIRERTHGWFAWILFSLISFTFIFWGVHSYTGNSGVSDSVATVNGTAIQKVELQTTYERLRLQQQFQYGVRSINPEAETQLKQQALQQLIFSYILRQSAIAEGLRYSLMQAITNIRTIPDFQINGHFSAEKFKQTLTNLSYSEAQFIGNIESAMLVNQMRVGFVNSAFALPNEIDTALQLTDQKRDIQYILVSAKSFLKNSVVEPTAIESFYTQHKADFQAPEKIKLEYLEVDLNTLKAKSSDKAEELFAEQSEKLANLTFSNAASLASAAKALNLPIKETDFFTKKGLTSGIAANSKVIATAFSSDLLLQNNNSQLIEINPQQVVVIRLKDHKPAVVQSLNEVRQRIISILQLQQAQKQARQTIEQILKNFTQGKVSELKQLQTDYKLPWIRKTKINRNDNSIPARVLRKAFQLPVADTAKAALVTMANGDFAIVNTNKIYNLEQKIPTAEQQVFKDRLQFLYGQFDYGLYVDSLFKKAKIKLEDAR